MEKPELEPYRTLAEAGPLAVAEEAKRRGLSPIRVMYVLHHACGIPLGTAKELALQVDPEAQAFHDQLMSDLDAVDAEIEEENNTS